MRNFAIISAVTVLFSYASITVYYTSYLRVFDIDIRSISFWPSLHDFVVPVAAIIVSMIILSVLFMSLGRLLGYLGKHIKHSNIKFFQILGDSMSLSDRFISLGVLFIALATIYVASDNLGAAMAEKQTRFTIITESSSNQELKKVLIYQNNGLGLVKDFDVNNKKFHDDYRVIHISDKKFTIEQIR